MNYLLVMPKKLSTGADTTSIIFPLGIAYVSAALKAGGFHVVAANLDFPERDADAALRELIAAHDIDVVCTGGLSLDCHKIKEVIDASRAFKPDVITVVGGGIISSDPQTAMGVLQPDIGVIGEGEQTMCELARALDTGASYDDVPGLVYWDSTRALRKTATRKEIEELDRIPFPDYDGFNYGDWVRHFGGAGVLLSDRSCPFRCTFCFHPTGVKYRQRSLDNIFREIEFQVQRYGITNVGLSSELFATTRQRVVDFCERIRPYGISWSCCLRVADVDADLLRVMKESGCYLVCFGLESADDTVLRSMRKGIKVAQIERALDLSIDAGISTEASNFIFGDVNETPETVAHTMAFWHRYNLKTHINLSLIQVYPGTHLYEYACEKGIIGDREAFLRDGCPFINVSKLTDDEFHALKSTVAEARLHPHVPAATVRLLDLRDDGICDVAFACRKCGDEARTTARFWYTNTCVCTRCRVKNEVDTFRSATCDERVLLRSIPDDSTVALWGAGGIYFKLVAAFPSLAGDRFVLVDGSTDLQGLRICGKTVHAPDAIVTRGIRLVIVTALSRKDAIVDTLRRRYPSVDVALIPSFQRDGERILAALDAVSLQSPEGDAS